MNTAQKNTVTYLRNGIIQILAIIAFAYLFSQAVTEWNAPAAEPKPEPIPECTACGCTTEPEIINVTASAL